MTTLPFKHILEDRLNNLLTDKLASPQTTESRVMIERISMLVLRDGKRSRPLLLAQTYAAYSGMAADNLIDIGLALELQHQFLLVHDDIMDNDTVRYDGPNMLGYYRQDYPPQETDIAVSMALMAGDLLYTFACQAILDTTGLSAAKKVSVLKLMQEANIAVQVGQQLDVVNVFALKPKLTAEKLLQTDLFKTASYSVRLPMQIAAELLDLTASERQKIDTFADAYGVLYQLVDDYSDYFQNDSSFDNHPKYRDFRQGKITYPLLYALEHAESADIALLREQASQKTVSDEAMHGVASILAACGAKQASQAQIADYYQQSVTALDNLAIDAAARTTFESMLSAFKL